jgi:hypothetical protein
MRTFLWACITAAALATAGAYGLQHFQQSTAAAFMTSSVRI